MNAKKNLQVKMIRSLPGANEFVSYIDAPGELDGERRILDFRDVALVVFVRRRLLEIQYLKATITEAQQKEFGELVASAVGQIEARQFPAAASLSVHRVTYSSIANQYAHSEVAERLS